MVLFQVRALVGNSIIIIFFCFLSITNGHNNGAAFLMLLMLFVAQFSTIKTATFPLSSLVFLLSLSSSSSLFPFLAFLPSSSQIFCFKLEKGELRSASHLRRSILSVFLGLNYIKVKIIIVYKTAFVIRHNDSNFKQRNNLIKI